LQLHKEVFSREAVTARLEVIHIHVAQKKENKNNETARLRLQQTREEAPQKKQAHDALKSHSHDSSLCSSNSHAALK
jgi:hypothetical protein